MTSTESVVEEAALAWLESAGWSTKHGAEIGSSEPAAERDDYGEVVLAQLNPDLPDAFLVEDGADRLRLFRIHNEHPEVSWHSLWGRVGYESRERPEYLWQSSAATGDFEPKFSLTPFTLGASED